MCYRKQNSNEIIYFVDFVSQMCALIESFSLMLHRTEIIYFLMLIHFSKRKEDIGKEILKEIVILKLHNLKS